MAAQFAAHSFDPRAIGRVTVVLGRAARLGVLGIGHFYMQIRQLASHWGAIQLFSAAGSLALFVGLPGVFSVASSVHPLVAVLSTLGGLTLMCISGLAIVLMNSYLQSNVPPQWPWAHAQPSPEPVAVMADGVRWRADEAAGAIAECGEHRIELVYRPYRVGWRGRVGGPIEPVDGRHHLGFRGTLYCADPGRPHRISVKDAGTYREARQRALVLMRSTRSS